MVSVLPNQTRSILNRSRPPLRRDRIPGARAAPALASRASTRLPRLCAQFWEHIGYHRRCVCFPIINYV
jgi:hypothetical protein